MKNIILSLQKNNNISWQDLLSLLNNMSEQDREFLISKANETRQKNYDNKVFLRGIVEFTNFCVRNCTYCGIRASNKNVSRYRLTFEEILDSCGTGYELGYRTFVLQGGEDSFYSDERIVEIVKEIKKRYPDCAVTLSIGEKSFDSYKKYYLAGADRYLMRFETSSEELYEKMHPNMSLENRLRCLKDLKKIGYQMGTGFIIGLPGQTNKDIAKDLLLLKELDPHMVGVGPFIPHDNTPFSLEKAGTSKITITIIAIIRLLLPEVLLPATTALGTINPFGREEGLKAGANVVMPNLSPADARRKYLLYNGKICTEEDSAKCIKCICARIEKAGFVTDMGRGDHKLWRRNENDYK